MEGKGAKVELVYGFETLVDSLLFGSKIRSYIAVPVCVYYEYLCQEMHDFFIFCSR